MSTPAPGRDRTRVAFIGGHGRSGSTLLARLLEGLPGVCSVGELRGVWDHGVLRDAPCGCGRPFSECELWQAVGAKAFGGWSEDLARDALRLRRSVDRVRAVPRLAVGRPEEFAREADEYAGMLAAIYRAATEVTGARVVVDSSKVPSTGYLMHRSPDLDPRVLHLVRDARGVAYSWTKVVARADADRTMARSTPARTAVRWDTFNLMTGLLRRQGVPRLLVRYEDVVTAPDDQLRRIAGFLDVPVADADLAFVDGDAVDLPVDHSVWGNPVRSATGPQRLRLDEAWRTELPQRQRQVVTALAAPGLWRYGYLSGEGAGRG